MAGLAVFGTSAVVAVTLWALTGLAFSGFSTALASRLPVDAPGDPALASAGISTAVNVGITVGALAGGLLVGNLGARSTVVVGSILSVAAVATRRLARYPRRVGRAV
jgi:predicted MFS family arabinose efflux permease